MFKKSINELDALEKVSSSYKEYKTKVDNLIVERSKLDYENVILINQRSEHLTKYKSETNTTKNILDTIKDNKERIERLTKQIEELETNFSLDTEDLKAIANSINDKYRKEIESKEQILLQKLKELQKAYNTYIEVCNKKDADIKILSFYCSLANVNRAELIKLSNASKYEKIKELYGARGYKNLLK